MDGPVTFSRVYDSWWNVNHSSVPAGCRLSYFDRHWRNVCVDRGLWIDSDIHEQWRKQPTSVYHKPVENPGTPVLSAQRAKDALDDVFRIVFCHSKRTKGKGGLAA